MAYETLIGFIVGMVVSTIIIYVAAKLLGEKEGIGTAVLAALIGAVIFAVTAYIFGVGWIASLIGWIAWLIALGSLYKMGWLKSFIVAVVIWIMATLVSFVLPTLVGQV